MKSKGPDWVVQDGNESQDLALLVAYKLKTNWNAKVRIITVIDNIEETAKAKKYLKDLIDLSRLPIENPLVLNGSFTDQFEHAPLADINIFGIFPGKGVEHYRELAMKIDTTCLFVLDSGHENIFA